MELVRITKIEILKPEHWQPIKSIYETGVATGNATFQTAAPASWEDWNTAHLQHSRFVAFFDGKVAGWIALSPTSARHCYRGVGEVSIYVDDGFHDKGIGSVLMGECIKGSEEQGMWSLYSSTFPENKRSIRLHEKFGFRVIGYREKIAELHGVWRDTVLMERRSKVVGI
jgi:L-amino acid N-acyltransferase YncA